MLTLVHDTARVGCLRQRTQDMPAKDFRGGTAGRFRERALARSGLNVKLALNPSLLTFRENSLSWDRQNPPFQSVPPGIRRNGPRGYHDPGIAGPAASKGK